MPSMDDLIKAIHSTPIIDNHAHPLLISSAQTKYPLLAITTEAHGNAMKATKSSLSHIRAVNQLSHILGCPANWDAVVNAIEVEKAKPGDVWAKRCLEGIETILIDDGLDGKDEVFDYGWHNRLTRSKCKRIVRIEKVAEEIIDNLLKESLTPGDIFKLMLLEFESIIVRAARNPEVVGFKSVICYRTGLNIAPGLFTSSIMQPEFVQALNQHIKYGEPHFKRLDGLLLNQHLVRMTALIIRSAPQKKPLQFHTGLGDNDITLTKSSPSHLQEFIREYPEVPIVLLHASYPWTKEAGYLASVYENVYADIGEVFPFLSKEGQENVIREVFELCPSEKVLWSTDGHWFPETYLLAVIQVREALEVVLPEYVRNKTLDIGQAIRLVEDIFFNTSNKLYDLKLPLTPLPLLSTHPRIASGKSDLDLLSSFLEEHPETKLLRLLYIDYTATPRLRIVPIKRALSVLQTQVHLEVGITKASLGLLQNDTFIPGVTGTGEYRLQAVMSSIRYGPSNNYASVQTEFRDANESEVDLCPRSILRRSIQDAKSHGLEFMIGFEIEVAFMPLVRYGFKTTSSNGHAWNTARAVDGNAELLAEISDALGNSGICLEQLHPEGAAGQFEFVLPPLPPLEAVDCLIQAREIITAVVAGHGMRATLHPKPFADQCGTASHAHISICSSIGEYKKLYESFYAGILRHLRAIMAFTYSSPESYKRMVDGCWAGGRWVTWGTQNRETPLRKIVASHWEIKCLDGLANMYLAMAAIISAGTQGLVDKYALTWQDCQQDPATMSSDERIKIGIHQGFPRDLNEALMELGADEKLRRKLGEEAVQRYIAVKRAEMKMLEGIPAQDRKDWIIKRY